MCTASCCESHSHKYYRGRIQNADSSISINASDSHLYRKGSIRREKQGNSIAKSQNCISFLITEDRLLHQLIGIRLQNRTPRGLCNYRWMQISMVLVCFFPVRTVCCSDKGARYDLRKPERQERNPILQHQHLGNARLKAEFPDVSFVWGLR